MIMVMMIMIRIWIQIVDYFFFLEPTGRICMKFVPAVYIGIWMIPVQFCDYGYNDCDPDLDPESEST